MSDAPSSPPVRLTKKQAAFRDFLIAGFGPSDAYRKAFDAKNMSRKAISVEAAKLMKKKHVALAIALARGAVALPAVVPAPSSGSLLSLQQRMEALAQAAVLDPAEAFDGLNHYKSIREMPEHVRRCIQSFKVDPVSFVTEVKFIDKRAAIMDYSKLAGDIPPPLQPESATKEQGRAPINFGSLSMEERLVLREKISAVIREHLNAPKVVNG